MQGRVYYAHESEELLGTPLSAVEAPGGAASQFFASWIKSVVVDPGGIEAALPAFLALFSRSSGDPAEELFPNDDCRLLLDRIARIAEASAISCAATSISSVALVTRLLTIYYI